MKSPCHKCADRAQGCHGKCDAYKAYDDENKRRRQADMAVTLAIMVNQDSFRFKDGKRIRKR